MHNISRYLITAAILFSLMACQSQSRANLLRLIDETPAKKLQSYHFDPSSPLSARIKPAPDFVIAFWSQTDKATDYASYTPTDAEKGMIGGYLSKLPRHFKDVLQQRLVAVYFIENLLGSGVTDYVLDDRENVYVVMLFNPAALKTDISTWMTFRENSIFIGDDPAVQIKINCGTQYSGFLYSLVHESAHAVDYAKLYTPYPEKQIKTIKQIKKTRTPFTEDVWIDMHTPRASYDFNARNSLTFYGADGGPKTSIRDAPQIYKQLSETPFVSLYGSTSWAEDFADFVMFYHLTQVLKQPYEIQLTEKSGSVRVFKPMDSPLVQKRFPIVQKFYEQRAGLR